MHCAKINWNTKQLGFALGVAKMPRAQTHRGKFYEFGPFSIDAASRVLSRDREPVSLTPKVFDTLLVLVENSGRVVTREEILEVVWPDSFVEESNITQNISVLRQVLAPHFEDNGPIQTIPKRGYRFTAPVRVRADA